MGWWRVEPRRTLRRRWPMTHLCSRHEPDQSQQPSTACPDSNRAHTRGASAARRRSPHLHRCRGVGRTSSWCVRSRARRRRGSPRPRGALRKTAPVSRILNSCRHRRNRPCRRRTRQVNFAGIDAASCKARRARKSGQRLLPGRVRSGPVPRWNGGARDSDHHRHRKASRRLPSGHPRRARRTRQCELDKMDPRRLPAHARSAASGLGISREVSRRNNRPGIASVPSCTCRSRTTSDRIHYSPPCKADKNPPPSNRDNPSPSYTPALRWLLAVLRRRFRLRFALARRRRVKNGPATYSRSPRRTRSTGSREVPCE